MEEDGGFAFMDLHPEEPADDADLQALLGLVSQSSSPQSPSQMFDMEDPDHEEHEINSYNAIHGNEEDFLSEDKGAEAGVVDGFNEAGQLVDHEQSEQLTEEELEQPVEGDILQPVYQENSLPPEEEMEQLAEQETQPSQDEGKEQTIVEEMEPSLQPDDIASENVDELSNEMEADAPNAITRSHSDAEFSNHTRKGVIGKTNIMVAIPEAPAINADEYQEIYSDSIEKILEERSEDSGIVYLVEYTDGREALVSFFLFSPSPTHHHFLLPQAN